MKKISKILAGALVLSMALTACGPKETTESEKPNGGAATSKGKIARQLIAFIADRLNQQ